MTVSLFICCPTWRRSTLLSTTLRLLRSKFERYDVQFLVSVNDGDLESYSISESILGDHGSVWLQEDLISYDEQLLFLFMKVPVGSYIWFIGDKYDYTDIDPDEIFQLLQLEPAAVFFKKWFYQKPASAWQLPVQAIEPMRKRYKGPLHELDFFPRLTIISASIFRINKFINSESYSEHIGGNFMQIPLCLDQIFESSSSVVFNIAKSDFCPAQSSFSGPNRWNESRGFAELVAINRKYKFFMGADFTHCLSLTIGRKKLGLSRMLGSNIPLILKCNILLCLPFLLISSKTRFSLFKGDLLRRIKNFTR